MKLACMSCKHHCLTITLSKDDSSLETSGVVGYSGLLSFFIIVFVIFHRLT